MGRLQLNLAMRAARLLRPGGTLVYAVCTLTREETLDVVAPLATDGGLLLDDLGAAYPELRHPDLGAALLTLPDRDGTSGFFVARLRRPPDATGS
jgi:16S rRNA (cytosine967-C5)-methyltransferase